MSIWKLPPTIKIYEALGCLADQRIHIDDNTAKVYSSSGNKFYTVTFAPEIKAIMCNDNGSYWQGYLGYPAIAFLLKRGIIPYSNTNAELLKNIMWKDINQGFNNDFAKTKKYCQDLVVERGGDLSTFLAEVERIHQHLEDQPLSVLGKKIKPPSGY